MKKFLKFGLIGLAAIALLWGALLLALWIVFPPEKVKTIVLERANQTLHRKVELEKASIRVFPFFGVSLKGLKVANNPDSGFAKDPLLELGSLDVRLSVASLFKMAPVVDQIVLDRPVVKAEVLTDGRTSFDGLGGPADTAKKPQADSVKAIELPFPLTVRRIAIEDGSVTWNDRKSDQQISIGSLSQEISVSTDKSLQNVESKGTLEVKDISMSGKGAPLRKGGIKFSVTHDVALNLPGAIVDVKNLRVGLQEVALKLSGKASNVRVAPVVDLKIGTDGPIDLAKLLAEIPKELNPELSKLTLAGKLEMAFAIVGKMGGEALPKIDGTLRLAGVQASVAGVPAKLSSLGTRIRVIGTRTVEIDSTNWNLDGAPGSLDVSVDSLPVGGHKSVPVLRKFLASGKIDLAALTKVAAPAVPVLDTMKPSGMLGWNVQAAGRLDPKTPAGITASGEVTFAKVSATIKGMPDRPVVDGSVNLSNAAAGAKVAVVTGPTDLSIDAKIQDWMAYVVPSLAEGKKMSMSLVARSKKIDLDRILPPPDTATKQAESKPLTELPSIPDVVADGSFTAETILAFGLPMGAVNGKVHFENGKLKESFSAAVAQGRVSQTLDADLSNPKVLGMNMTSDFTGVQIHDVLVAVKDRLPEGNPRRFHDKLFGKGNIALKAWGKALLPEFGQKMSADITMSLAQGKVAGFPAVAAMTAKANELFPSIPKVGDLDFATMGGGVQLREGKLILQDIAMEGSSLGALKVAGFIAADQTMALKVDTHLPQSASAGLQSGASTALAASGNLAGKLGLASGSPLPQDDQKRVLISWLVNGTVAQPTVSPDLPRISDLAKGAAMMLANEAKAQAEARLRAETDKLKAEAEARANAEKAKLQKAAEDQANKATDKAKDKLKGLIKKPW
ncbi:MAG: AsmA family protein [Fibrobacterota bacterium]|nr:AsmA family protein [Fibrobacterota bacterium]QQS07018.1 MAG: AsmA family protein [Fibrobacterota bacterium]